MSDHKCRFCGGKALETVLDLGASPLANALIDPALADAPESTHVLSLAVCPDCLLAQAPDVPREAIFTEDYVYHSSWSDAVLAHSRAYVEAMSRRFGLGAAHKVVEVASNDGYLLRYFAARGVPVLGIEPCASVAQVARSAGVPTRIEFFGTESARELRAEGVAADLLIGNNVYVHVPDINDFTQGLKVLLAPEGVATLEFPHLLRLLRDVYFDTIYHEHYSYLSLITAERILAAHGLRVFDVEEIAPQGGSLRIYACHAESARPTEDRVGALRSRELEAGLGDLAVYRGYAEQVHRRKRALLRFLLDAREAGRTVAGYGAPAKGNTFLNFCGVKPDLLPFTVDVSPHKQGRLLPGSRIPIAAPDEIFRMRPDYVLILPWNIREEIMARMAGIAAWGGRFVVALPELAVLDPAPAAPVAQRRPERASLADLAAAAAQAAPMAAEAP